MKTRFELAGGWYMQRAEAAGVPVWIICDPNGDRLGNTEKHLRELDAALSLPLQDGARRKLDFLIEEIIDREGREGITDYDFAEQVIALAYRTKEQLLADEEEGKS